MKKNKRILLIVFILFIVGTLSFYGYKYYLIYKNGESKYLYIKLNGKKKVVLNYKDEYIDYGAKASYKNQDITKDIKVTSDIDFNKIGTYIYTYTIKYKKQEKSVKRKVIIVDNENPVIELNGDKEISLYIGSNYEEKGAKATDNYDQDLTGNVQINGNVDTNKAGEYIITYKVVDSSNNEASITRKVKVIPKPVVEQKVAVLNYHFFYENWDNEPCHETICESMTKFRQQLKYLNDNGFKTLTMKEFVSWMYGEIEIPKKSVLITIDDGAYGTSKINGNHLIPALEEYKINATLFLITGWWDIANYKSDYLTVESHTHDLHIGQQCNGYGSKVNCISYEDLISDLKKSVAVTKSTDAFCFPFYEYSDKSIKAVKEIGFKVAFIGGNRKASRKDNKYKIPRYVIYDSTSLQSFINMVN